MYFIAVATRPANACNFEALWLIDATPSFQPVIDCWPDRRLWPDVHRAIASRLEKTYSLRHPLLWGRFEQSQIGRVKAWRRTGFFGHTPVSNYEMLMRTQQQTDRLQMLPVVGPNIVLLDTAAALGLDGRLTAMCVETRNYLQVDHFGRLVAPKKGA